MSSQPPGPTFISRFLARSASAGSPGLLRWSAFMDLALYDAQVGYYASARLRVGRDHAADFYTSASLGPTFGRLVVAAAAHLAGGKAAAASLAFVEIGAEPGSCLLDGVDHPFASATTLRLGDAATPPLKRQALVSNELLDAQPVVRLVGRDGRWLEAAVRLSGSPPSLSWDVATDLSAEATAALALAAPHANPAPADGEILDLPFAAVRLLRSLAAPGWSGVFIAFDYGLPAPALLRERPAGTLRAYHRHTTVDDLLDRPGEQDLTAHVCWDWLADALRDCCFQDVGVSSQEAFLVRHAGDELSRLVAAAATEPPPRRTARTLQHLLHPGHLGQRFQVLHGIRPHG